MLTEVQESHEKAKKAKLAWQQNNRISSWFGVKTWVKKYSRLRAAVS